MLVHSEIEGVTLLQSAPHEDERGSFRECFVLSSDGWKMCEWRICEAFNLKRGTLRGMHYQQPTDEQKCVWCASGSIWDVTLDLRPGSPSFGKHQGFRLDGAPDAAALMVPPGVAHGYITLKNRTTVQYAIRGERREAEQKGVRYDDPRFGIYWPEEPQVISARDAAWPHWSGP